MSTTLLLPGMTPANLGPDLFLRVLTCVRSAAERYASGRHQIKETYETDTWRRTGYQVVVPDAATAAHVQQAHDLAMQRRPMAWVCNAPA